MALTTNEKWNYGLALGAMGAIVGMAVYQGRKESSEEKLQRLWKEASDPATSEARRSKISNMIEDLLAGGTGRSTSEYSTKMRQARNFAKLYGDE